mmetsp:Transcript_41594/g.63470  ORF Transcript_41594/g.63470 Transcript_41594/m.63470 type:complete len:203 (-) Transcript_41594:56-664(-)
MWKDNSIESEGMFAVSQNIASLLREAWNNPNKGPWTKAMNAELKTALLNIESLPLVEADILLSLISGGEVGGLHAGSTAITDKDQFITILGYSSTWKLESEFFSKSRSSSEYETFFKNIKIEPEFTSPTQMAIGLFLDKDQKKRQDMMLLQPSTLTPIDSIDLDLSKSVAEDSPIMEPATLKHLLQVLKLSIEKDSFNNLCE